MKTVPKFIEVELRYDKGHYFALVPELVVNYSQEMIDSNFGQLVTGTVKYRLHSDQPNGTPEYKEFHMDGMIRLDIKSDFPNAFTMLDISQVEEGLFLHYLCGEGMPHKYYTGNMEIINENEFVFDFDKESEVYKQITGIKKRHTLVYDESNGSYTFLENVSHRSQDYRNRVGFRSHSYVVDSIDPALLIETLADEQLTYSDDKELLRVFRRVLKGLFKSHPCATREKYLERDQHTHAIAHTPQYEYGPACWLEYKLK